MMARGLPRIGFAVLAVFAAPVHAAAADAGEDPRESLAYHVGTIAYLWGYPIVDLTKQLHNETHRVSAPQPVAAPLNRFYRHAQLVTPEAAGELRAPNHDTLYFGGWFDLTNEPVVIQTPDTQGRYYTLAITDFFNEVTHIGRRTTGTQAQVLALAGPATPKVAIPPGVHVVEVATSQVWILGRLLVNGVADLPDAQRLLRGFWAAPWSRWRRDQPPPEEPVPAGTRLDPMQSIAFFTHLNQWLRANKVPPQELALLGLFDQIGIGPSHRFEPESLDAGTRRGLDRAIADGRAMLINMARQPQSDVRNGWIFPLQLADYGQNYLLRASVAFGGYANRPEETVYAALLRDADGAALTGQLRYRLHFSPGEQPPVGAFWSVTAYDARTLQLIPNGTRRFSVGNLTPKLQRGRDGSIAIEISTRPPKNQRVNWLPVGRDPFMLILRMYEPGPAVLDGRFGPPPIEVLGDLPLRSTP
ncbi:MAG: DUF1254 domain-containing protein [Acidobacteria bacterium]|nr:DUF1254 domain-containing protein [Acidobacteriota bacterium]